MENMEWWSPAPAHSVAWSSSETSSSVRILAGCPTGATPPTSWPVWCRTKSGAARRIRPVPNWEATSLRSTFAAPLARISRGEPSTSNTRLLVIAATSQPRAAAAAAAVGTVPGRTVTVSRAPAAVRTLATGSAGKSVLPPSVALGIQDRVFLFFRRRPLALPGNRRTTAGSRSSVDRLAIRQLSVLGIHGGVARLLPCRVAKGHEHEESKGEPLKRIGQVRPLLHGGHGERLRHVRHLRCLGRELPVGAGQERIAELGGVRGQVYGGQLALRRPALQRRLAVLEAPHCRDLPGRRRRYGVRPARGFVANRQPATVDHHGLARHEVERHHNLVTWLPVQGPVAHDSLPVDVVSSLELDLRPFPGRVQLIELAAGLGKRDGSGRVVGRDPMDFRQRLGPAVHLPAAQEHTS